MRWQQRQDHVESHLVKSFPDRLQVIWRVGYSVDQDDGVWLFAAVMVDLRVIAGPVSQCGSGGNASRTDPLDNFVFDTCVVPLGLVELGEFHQAIAKSSLDSTWGTPPFRLELLGNYLVTSGGWINDGNDSLVGSMDRTLL